MGDVATAAGGAGAGRAGGAGAWPVDLVRRMLELGIGERAPRERRRLMCVNAAAHAATVVGLVLLVHYISADPWLYRWVIAVNLLMVVVSLSIPLLHRLGAHAGWIVLIAFADVDLFAVTAMLGRDSGLHLLLFAAPAVMFVMFGLERLHVAIPAILVSVAFYLAAQRGFPVGTLGDAVPDDFLFRLHAISATGLAFIVASVLYYVLWLNRRAEERVEALMRRTFPEAIAQRLMDEPDRPIADACPAASVLFADLEGFVSLSRALGARLTVELLNDLFSRLDRLAESHGVERIKTIGDAYMAACGVPEPVADHAARMARFALAMQGEADAAGERFGVRLRLRVGIASGPATAGVIGTRRFGYDLWGEAVNLAARLEGRCPPGSVLVSEEFRDAAGAGLASSGRVTLDVKGLGRREAHLLATAG